MNQKCFNRNLGIPLKFHTFRFHFPSLSTFPITSPITATPPQLSCNPQQQIKFTSNFPLVLSPPINLPLPRTHIKLPSMLFSCPEKAFSEKAQKKVQKFH
jgi:hypothetical protein